MSEGLSNEARLLKMRYEIIPYHVQAVYVGLRALTLGAKHHPLDRIEIRVDGVPEPVHTTVMGAYADTASSMAAIYSRLLLEFLGLKIGGMPSTLQSIKRRTRAGDVGIENFQSAGGRLLEKVDPSIVSMFDSPDEVGRAWITTCEFAGQRLAHVTDDFKLGGIDVTPMLRRTFETVPQLVRRGFIDELD